MEHRLTLGKLLDSNGHLQEAGYATRLVREYSRKDIKAPALRIKEWDYYLIYNGRFGVALTLDDNSYMSMLSASILDFSVPCEKTVSPIGMMPMGKTNLPSTSAAGISRLAIGKSKFTFTVGEGKRHLVCRLDNFLEGKPFEADIWLAEEPRHPAILQEAEISGCEPLQGSLKQAASVVSHVHKLLCIGDAMRIRALQKELRERFPRLMALRSKPEYLEILSPESTKRGAAQVLLDHYGLDAKQAVAFGDSDVDLDMLQYCGFGVAMGNAPRQLKEQADYVTASNDEEGVYIALNSLRLKAPCGSRKPEKCN